MATPNSGLSPDVMHALNCALIQVNGMTHNLHRKPP
jgi:hypothetical protein